MSCIFEGLIFLLLDDGRVGRDAILTKRLLKEKKKIKENDEFNILIK